MLRRAIFPGATFCCLALTGAGAFLGPTRVAQTADRKPNIVQIVADDLGWKDVGFNGCKDIKTPNLDKLAAGGVKFTQFYSQCICTPARACLMTGRYPFRYGLQTVVIPSVATYGLDTTEWLLPQSLKEAGYKSALIGKWHLGHGDQKYWPRQRGFDYFYGMLIGEVDYFTHEEHGVLDWFRDNQPLREKGYATTLLGRDAVRYIQAQGPDQPFYLYLAFNAPHTPYEAPQEYIDRYPNIADPTRRTYAAMVTCLDEEIGHVVAALDAKGIRNETLIFFQSDNGGSFNPMFTGVMADVSKIKIPCDNGPYRDGKGSLYEGGTLVCACANWPGHIKAGSTADELIHAVDLYPTIAELAGASTAKCKPLDGLNVWGAIAESKPSPRAEIVYGVEPYRAGIRQANWKLVWRTVLPYTVELFDLAQDPYEKTNLAAGNPDKVAAFQQRANDLAEQAAKPLFLVEQLRVIMNNMRGEPALPTAILPGDPAMFGEDWLDESNVSP
jgi:arylsulfatase A-like enzyme